MLSLSKIPQKRGFKESTIKDLKIGFAQGNWDLILNQLSHKYSIKVLEAASLISQRRDKSGYYDYFRKRIMFPVFDMLGKVTGFGGRTIDPNDDIKYLNSREIQGIFEKRNALYLIDRAKRESTRKGHLIMMEGYTDAALAHQIGLTNAFATAGTSVTQAHALLLKKITDRIVICMDADSAGRKAAIAAAHLFLNTGINVELALLPDKKDPADMILEEQQNFQKRIDSAVSLFDFTFEDAIRQQNTSSTHNKVLVLKQLAPVLKAAPDVITCKTYIAKIAQELDLPYEIAAEAVDFTTGQPKSIPITPFPTTEHEYNIASLLLRKPAYRNEIGMRLLPEHFKNNEMRVLFAYFREGEQTKEDKISINYKLSQAPSLFDAQYTQDLPKELIEFAKRTGLPAEENKMYRLVSELQKTCAPEIGASQAITNLLKAHYRHELKLMEEQIEDADIRGDTRNLEQLMQKYKQTYQEFSKLSFSRRD